MSWSHTRIGIVWDNDRYHDRYVYRYFILSNLFQQLLKLNKNNFTTNVIYITYLRDVFTIAHTRLSITVENIRRMASELLKSVAIKMFTIFFIFFMLWYLIFNTFN